jgi:hypothetical protein
VCDQKTSKNEEAKARYRAVKVQPQWVVTAGKQTNKQQTIFLTIRNISAKFVEKIKNLFMFRQYFFENRIVYGTMWNNMVDRKGHRQQHNTAHAHCLLHN